MAQESEAYLTCPSCGRKYRIRAELAGRKVICKCGQKLRIPTGDAHASEDGGGGIDAYELAGASGGVAAGKAANAANRCPKCGNHIAPRAVLCINCGFNLQSGQKVTTELGVMDGAGAPDTLDAGNAAAAVSPMKTAGNPQAEAAGTGSRLWRLFRALVQRGRHAGRQPPG
ncbi:MAG: hypothetical protein WD042_03920 [Phycisphaeraceae bacterium]